jgi:flagellar export protein FliJ
MLMSGFNFRLQKVLDLRLWKEQERAGQLSRARQAMQEATQALEHLSAVRTATRTQITDAHGAGGAVGHLRNLREVLSQLDERITEAAGRHEEAQAQVQNSLAEYTVAFQERRILEQLRERQAEESRIAENEAERKELDEIALTRHTRPAEGGEETAP